MKYLLQRRVNNLYIVCDFIDAISSKYQDSADSALHAPLIPMGNYWPTARHFASQDELEIHLQRYWQIIKRITDKPTEPQAYEYW